MDYCSWSYCCNTYVDEYKYTVYYGIYHTFSDCVQELFMKVECAECEGTGIVMCGHESHHIDSMSCCRDTNCVNGWIPCEICDGEGELIKGELK